MLYAQVGQHHPARTTETSPKRSSGTLSCLSARPGLMISPPRRPHSPRWRACGRALSTVCILQAGGGGAFPEVAYRRSIVVSPLRAYTLLAAELPNSLIYIFVKRTDQRTLPLSNFTDIVSALLHAMAEAPVSQAEAAAANA